MKNCIRAIVLPAFAALMVASAVVPQSPPETRRKEFGSSLKRLKWNSKEGIALEKRDGFSRGVQSEETIKLGTLLVALNVLVMDAKTHRIIEGLSREEFLITEDDKPQQISEFSVGSNFALPRSIILLIDYSGSQNPFFETSIEAARVLVSQLAPKDRMAIVTDDVQLLTDFSQDKAKLNATLDWLKKRWKERKFGKSRQFTALLAAIRELVDQETRCVIIFQTDGDQLPFLRDQRIAEFNLSEYARPEFGLRDIYNAAEKSSATIYSIITNGRLIDLPADEVYATARKTVERVERARFKTEAEYQRFASKHPLTNERLQLWIKMLRPSQVAVAQTALLTGGATLYLDEPEQASEIFSQILFDVNSRYLIGYYPANSKRDGTRRNVRIEVRGHPEYIVHSRKSYFAPKNE